MTTIAPNRQKRRYKDNEPREKPQGRPVKNNTYKRVRVPAPLWKVLKTKAGAMRNPDGTKVWAYELMNSLIDEFMDSEDVLGEISKSSDFLMSYGGDDWAIGYISPESSDILKETATEFRDQYPEIRGSAAHGINSTNLLWLIVMRKYPKNRDVRKLAAL